ncbi:MAG TPA: heavy-metal-associated domain-containing protein [Arenicellales bacterium]|nr:heavy-metal-associated domain-containing protein [Arenicellales bacterium]
MKRYLIVPLLLLWSLTALAAGTQYTLRVDGLACPYCAYGIEKKLKQIEGVEKIDVDLQKGLVVVDVREGVQLTEPQMQQLFKDAGFTYRSMKEKPL